MRTATWLLVLGMAVGCGGGGGGGQCRRSTPTTSGPGDVLDHFPVSTGSRWLYDVTEMLGAAQGPRYRMKVEVTGTQSISGTTASVFTSTRLDTSQVTDVSVLSKGPSGVTEHAGGGLEPALAQLYPYQIITFPLTPGSSYEQLSCRGLDYGADLDGDGRNERFDVESRVTVIDEGPVSVSAGTFTATRVETRVALVIHATSGQEASAEAVELDWYAPGVGVVRSRTEFKVEASTETIETTLVGWAADGTEGGLVALGTLATDLAEAGSDTQMPGRPALSFDGAGHLLAARVSPGTYGPVTIRGWVIAPDGTPGPSFPLADRAGDAVAAAFNGTSHLVVSNAYGDTRVFGQRVTPAGAVLDGPGGFTIWTSSVTGYRPSVASDGSGWLVAWATYEPGVRMALVSAAGGVTAPTLLRAAEAGDPVVAFGAGIYLVAWAEAGKVYALRIGLDGTILDTQPLLVSASPGMKQMGSVAFDGTRFLVVWSDDRLGGGGSTGYPALDVWAARVQPDGTVLDGDPTTGGIAVNILSGWLKEYPVVEWAGGVFLVSWFIEGYGEPAGIYAARVSSDGALLDGPPSEAFLVGRATEYAALFVHPAVAPCADGKALLAWTNNREVIGTRKSIEAAWLAPPARP